MSDCRGRGSRRNNSDSASKSTLACCGRLEIIISKDRSLLRDQSDNRNRSSKDQRLATGWCRTNPRSSSVDDDEAQWTFLSLWCLFIDYDRDIDGVVDRRSISLLLDRSW